MICPDCAAKDALIRDLRDCVQSMQEEFAYIDACERGIQTGADGPECLCHSGAKRQIEDADEMLRRTR